MIGILLLGFLGVALGCVWALLMFGVARLIVWIFGL
jgi:hypothetical protein